MQSPAKKHVLRCSWIPSWTLFDAKGRWMVANPPLSPTNLPPPRSLPFISRLPCFEGPRPRTSSPMYLCLQNKWNLMQVKARVSTSWGNAHGGGTPACRPVNVNNQGSDKKKKKLLNATSEQLHHVLLGEVTHLTRPLCSLPQKKKNVKPCRNKDASLCKNAKAPSPPK